MLHPSLQLPFNTSHNTSLQSSDNQHRHITTPLQPNLLLRQRPPLLPSTVKLQPSTPQLNHWQHCNQLPTDRTKFNILLIHTANPWITNCQPPYDCYHSKPSQLLHHFNKSPLTFQLLHTYSYKRTPLSQHIQTATTFNSVHHLLLKHIKTAHFKSTSTAITYQHHKSPSTSSYSSDIPHSPKHFLLDHLHKPITKKPRTTRPQIVTIATNRLLPNYRWANLYEHIQLHSSHLKPQTSAFLCPSSHFSILQPTPNFSHLRKSTIRITTEVQPRSTHQNPSRQLSSCPEMAWICYWLWFWFFFDLRLC